MEARMHPVVEKTILFYQHHDFLSGNRLGEIYAENIRFIDPFGEIDGVDNLARYFSSMEKNLIECRFDINRVCCSADANEAVLFWAMSYRHRRLARGGKLCVNGNSHLCFEEKIYFHRDYFDAAAMVYEHLPVLGFLLGKIKQRLA